MSKSSLLLIHTDGASRGNPGAAAYAYVIAQDDEPPIEEAGCLGQMTNNQAEYTALVRALEHALELGGDHRLLIHSDSELLVKQMKGEYRVKNEELRSLYDQARALCQRFSAGVTLRHVRRAENSRADALCNEALDGKRLPMPRGPRPAPSLPPSSSVPGLRKQVLAFLSDAARNWSDGLESPSVEDLWKELLALLERHGVSVPSEAR